MSDTPQPEPRQPEIEDLDDDWGIPDEDPHEDYGVLDEYGDFDDEKCASLPTPPEVIDALGYDPDDEDWDEDERDEDEDE